MNCGRRSTLHPLYKKEIRVANFCPYPCCNRRILSVLTACDRFIHAAIHSRACLRTTRDMLTLAFTYFQVMPEFLDFLFLFGEQEHAQGLYYSGFHQCTHLTGAEMGRRVDTRNWSGRDMQVCYCLKSVESSPSQEHWPWSIQNCAVHHSFDAGHVRSTWLIIKGDNLIEKRIKLATSEKEVSIGKSAFETIETAFGAALTTHLLIYDWSAENWHDLIKYLEERFEKIFGEIFEMPSSESVKRDKYGQRVFSFQDLQNIQHLKERANETVLVLRLNLNVIVRLKQHYLSISECHELPENISRSCKWELIKFRRRIDGITTNLELQILRIEKLLCSLTDRNTLVGSLMWMSPT